MVRQHTQKSTYKKIVIVIGIALAIVVSLVIFEKLGYIDVFSSKPKGASANPNSEIAPSNTVDYSSPASNAPDPSINSEKNPTESSPPVSTNTLSVTITRAGQDASGSFTAVAAIDGASTGTCTLELYKDSVVAFQKSTNIRQEGSLNVCYDFYTVKSDLPAAGEYAAKISAVNGTSTGSSTQKVTIR